MLHNYSSGYEGDYEVKFADAPKCYSRNLRRVAWPRNFKITGVDKYNGKLHPKQWLQSYATTVSTTGGNAKVMANYLPVQLAASVLNWLTHLREDSIGT